jgi:hypothetical protein
MLFLVFRLNGRLLQKRKGSRNQDRQATCSAKFRLYCSTAFVDGGTYPVYDVKSCEGRQEKKAEVVSDDGVTY